MCKNKCPDYICALLCASYLLAFKCIWDRVTHSCCHCRYGLILIWLYRRQQCLLFSEKKMVGKTVCRWLKALVSINVRRKKRLKHYSKLTINCCVLHANAYYTRWQLKQQKLWKKKKKSQQWTVFFSLKNKIFWITMQNILNRKK